MNEEKGARRKEKAKAMATAQRFEELIAWQRARQLTKDIYELTRASKFAGDRSLVDQIRRASVSVMSNIAEGYERRRVNEFHQSLVVAKGECGEVRSELYVALDAEYVSQDRFAAVLATAEEASRVIEGLRASVDRRRG